MNYWVYDTECFKHDTLFVFKKLNEQEFRSFWITNENDKAEDLRNFIEDKTLIGYNNYYYDDALLWKATKGVHARALNKLSIKLIKGDRELSRKTGSIRSLDCLQEMSAIGISLKKFEANVGDSIEESSVPFDIDRALTDEEKEQTKFYCLHDVVETEKVFNLRKQSYFDVKEELLKMADLPEKAYRWTTGTIASYILLDDEQICQYEEPLLLRKLFDETVVQSNVIEMWKNALLSGNINKGERIETNLWDCSVVFGHGGLHGVSRCYEMHENVLHADVASMYPSIIAKCELLGDATEIYDQIRKDRIAIKKSDPVKADALKLILNKCYGLMGSETSKLFSPLARETVCVIGQLLISWICEELHKAGCTLLNINTDGVFFLAGDKDYEPIIAAFEETFDGFSFAVDKYDKFLQRDVNNYVALIDDKIETKGSSIGGFNADQFFSNNSQAIVKKAAVNKILFDKEIEETLSEEKNDPLLWQYVTETGKSFDRVIGSDQQEYQRTNRLFAVKEGICLQKEKEGRLHHYNNAPRSAIVHNGDVFTFNTDLLDLDFYREKAEQLVSDFTQKPVIPDRKKFPVATHAANESPSYSKHWKNQELTWKQFITPFKTPKRDTFTSEEYAALSGPERTKRKEIYGAFFAGVLSGPQKTKENVVSRSMITLDFDDNAEDLLEKARDLIKVKAVVHSTRSHTPEEPRYRIIVPLKRDVTPDEFVVLTEKFAAQFDISIDDCSKRITQMMFRPTVNKDQRKEYAYLEFDGPLLDPNDYLDGEQIANVCSSKRDDPRNGDGIVAEFCRAFSCEDILEMFPDKYEKIGNRWKPVDAKSVAGIALLDGGIWLYCHHSEDDLCTGHALNAFDVMRILKHYDFGQMSVKATLMLKNKDKEDEVVLEQKAKEHVSQKEKDDQKKDGDISMKGFVRGSSRKAKKIEWLIKGVLPANQLSIMGADGGTGKGFLCAAIVRDLLNGYSELWDKPAKKVRNVAILSAEDDLDTVLIPRYEAAGCDMDHVLFAEISAQDMYHLDDVNLKRLYRNQEIDLVVIDPIQAFIPPELKMSERNQMRQIIKPLLELGLETKTATLVVMHTNKTNSFGRQKLADSSDFFDQSRFVMMCGQVADSETFDRYLWVAKTNYGDRPETLIVNLKHTGIYDDPEVEDRVVYVKERNHKTARELELGQFEFQANVAQWKTIAKEIVDVLNAEEDKMMSADDLRGYLDCSKNVWNTAVNHLKGQQKIKKEIVNGKWYWRLLDSSNS